MKKSSDERTLIPIEQKDVAFYDDTIVAVRVPPGDVYIPLRQMCDFLGIDWSSQRQRIKRDPVLEEKTRSVVVTTTDRGDREMLSLPLGYLAGWLFGINASRVREEVRDRLIRYQRECYDVLAEAFEDGRLTADPALDELLAGETDAVATYKMLRAMTRLARNQVLLEARMEGYESRLEELETTLGNPDRTISPAQASRISQAVKAIAMKISEQSGRNEYGGVYGELYRRFEIPGYRELPANRFEEAMSWLTDWWQQVAGTDDVPF
ncbi:MAG: phage antirepressor N-terminal domain-containing protein [Chloroflexota bacterium]